jgi:hypothetical protein
MKGTIVSISHRIGLACLLAVCATSLAPADDRADPLVLEDSWQETMLATHARYAALTKNTHVTLGPWWTTGALDTEGFAHALFP